MSKNILIVDDDAVVLHLLTATLESVGHRITCLNSGLDALKLLESPKNVPDLLILDLQLEDIKGSEIIVSLRANPHTADLPILLLSANSEVEVQQLYPNTKQADHFLQKPFEMPLAIKLVDKLTQ